MDSMLVIGSSLLLFGIAVGGYAFAGYPLLLGILRIVRRDPAPGSRHPSDDFELPRLSVTVPVFNEAHQLHELLESLVALDYPPDRLQILLVSDGSTDGSDELIGEWSDRGIELLRVDQRGGKGEAENSARSHLRGNIIVNSDASIRIRPDGLLRIVEPFADPRVGVVSGRDVSVAKRDDDANRGEAGYVGYEMRVRELETATGGIVGASGSFYATRRELHDVAIPPKLSRDFASALVARDHGLVAVSQPDAVCYVPRTRSLRLEYRRKVRTIARGMSTLWAWRHLLNPIRHRQFAWKLWSHKVSRWMLPFALILTASGLGILATREPLALLGLAAGVVVLVIGASGWAAGHLRNDLPLHSLISAPAYLLLSNVAVLHALVRSLRGGSERLWEPTRRGTGGHTVPEDG